MVEKVCYLSTGIMDTAFDSQVLPVLQAALSNNLQLIHIAFGPFRGKVNETCLQKRTTLERMGIKTVYLRQVPPILPLFLTLDVQRMNPFLRVWWREEGRTVLHCRGHLNAYRGLILKKKYPSRLSVIADLRGAASDEISQGLSPLKKHLASPLRNCLQRIESCVVERADEIFCVSHAFREHLESRYRREGMIVIPTFVDAPGFRFSESARKEYRKRLGVSDRVVLVYSGGVARWQNIENIVQLFVDLQEKRKNLFMLFLTPEPSVIQRMVGNSIRPEDHRVLRVSHGEVGSYLCAADVGILLRDDTLTNHVASPIKFSEYMCAGLPCIVSRHIGDTEQILEDGNAGIVLNHPRDSPDPHQFEKMLKADRESLSKKMLQKYSAQIHLPKIAEVYGVLSERAQEGMK